MALKGGSPKRPATEQKAKGRESAHVDNLSIVRKMLESFAGTKQESVKGTIGDFIRLVALEKELREEREIREIRVRWVETFERES
jgi:hypothetical protein